MTESHFTAEHVENAPDEYERGKLYLLGGNADGGPFRVEMICPKDGCDMKIQLPMPNPMDRSGWTVQEHSDGTVTLDPSVRTGCCRSCHFYIRRNKIIFV